MGTISGLIRTRKLIFIKRRGERERQQIFGNTEIIIFRAIVSLSYGHCSFCSPEIYGLDKGKCSKQKTNSLTLYGVVTIITQNSCIVERITRYAQVLDLIYKTLLSLIFNAIIGNCHSEIVSKFRIQPRIKCFNMELIN